MEDLRLAIASVAATYRKRSFRRSRIPLPGYFTVVRPRTALEAPSGTDARTTYRDEESRICLLKRFVNWLAPARTWGYECLLEGSQAKGTRRCRSGSSTQGDLKSLRGLPLDHQTLPQASPSRRGSGAQALHRT